MQRSQTPTTQRPHRTSAPPWWTEGNVTKNGTWEVPCTAFKSSSGTATARDLQGRLLNSGVGRPGTRAEGAPVTTMLWGHREPATEVPRAPHSPGQPDFSPAPGLLRQPDPELQQQQHLKLQFRGGTSRTRARCRRKYRLHAEAAVWLALYRTWAGRKKGLAVIPRWPSLSACFFHLGCV